ncbi:PD40 domain-containing protein [Erythrobacter sp. NFXS35]|uniref:amidohydrolase family protein n=1 Tax=Erythrobacter sp. NFXS35 TaxID=2818436 RepID=UPI0032E0051E
MDLLGHVWRLPVEGGQAESMTQGSGVALNFHPRYSPDSRHIAFISDRSGQNNVWVMNADGSKPRALLLDKETRFTEPVWAPDGKSVVAVRTYKTPGRSWHRQNETLWRLFLDGSPPVQLLAGRADHYTMPAFSPDGTSLYFNVSFSTNLGKGLLNAGWRVLRYEFSSGRTFNLDGTEFTGLTPEFQATLDATGYAEVAGGALPPSLSPVPSPDGRLLAFAREVPGETFEYRGHTFGPRTSLFLRNLETGVERRLIPEAAKDATRMNAQYSYRAYPGFSWSADGKSLFANYRGQIHRIDVASGRETAIPFSAHVRRVGSEQARGNRTIDDRAVAAKYLQWPTVSPTGDRTAFEAFGSVWVMTTTDGEVRPLLEDGMASGIEGQQMMPTFSPDGSQIAFVTWSAQDGGQIWRMPASGGRPVAVSTAPGTFAYPAWSSDGQRLLTVRRALPEPDARGYDARKAWSLFDKWTVISTDLVTQAEKFIADISSLRPAYFAENGSVLIEEQRNPAGLQGLMDPFPPQSAIEAVSSVISVAPDGTATTLLNFAPRVGVERTWNYPVVSPDGQRVVWSSAGKTYVADLRAPLFSAQTVFDADPNLPREGVTEISAGQGGEYPRWRNNSVIDFVSSDRLLSYDTDKSELGVLPITLRIPRKSGERPVLFKGGTLITMQPGSLPVTGDLRVTGARIACMGDCQEEPGDMVMDVAGKYLLPGFIDVHAHHFGRLPMLPEVLWERPEFTLDLAFGVTTIVDPATAASWAFPWAQAVEGGMVRGPRIFTTADIVIGQGTTFGDRNELDSLDDARFEVRRRTDFGAIAIKNYRVARREQQQWLAQASREVPVTLTGEGGPLLANVGLALDGQTGWEHNVFDLPLAGDASTFFGKAGINYSPTVGVAGHVNGAKEYWRTRFDFAGDARHQRFADPQRLEADSQLRPHMPKREFSFPIVAEGLADIVRAGGTGTVGEHGEQPGLGTHWEIWSYAEAMTPIEALRLATLHPAQFIGLDRELGSLAVGKIADILVLDADPLEDVQNTLSIRYVMQAGDLLETATLESVTPR